MEVVSSITLPKTVENSSSIGTRVILERLRNDKVISQVTIGSFGLKCGILLDPAKRRPSCGLFGIRWWQSVSGEQGCLS